MDDMRPVEFSDREVRTARAFCIAVGAFLIIGGGALWRMDQAVAHYVGLGLSLCGGALVVLGAVGPRAACVRTAATVLSLF